MSLTMEKLEELDKTIAALPAAEASRTRIILKLQQITEKLTNGGQLAQPPDSVSDIEAATPEEIYALIDRELDSA